jgi:ribonucleoside-diphosphate reductase alpha chain
LELRRNPLPSIPNSKRKEQAQWKPLKEGQFVAEKIPDTLPAETLAAFDSDSLRARIFFEKYALRNGENEPVEKLPEQMWKRLAAALASVEKPEKRAQWERNFLGLLSDFKFVPGGRILHAIGNPNKVTALNCYVLPSPHDSLPSIYRTGLELAETFKRGGGCGVDISTLRPKDSPAHNAARVSTGAVSFMELYSLTTGIIGQQGRRGALMITISDSHPDVLDFCRIKTEPLGSPLRQHLGKSHRRFHASCGPG